MPRERRHARLSRAGECVKSGTEAQVGQVLENKWRIVAVIGEGGMGAVYEAVHVRNGARVAVKLLHLDVARESTAKERFLQEGYAANKVKHQGVVRVLDDGVTREGSFYMVMELLEGHSIERIAEERGGTLSADEVIRYSVALLDVMATAHKAGVVHRDLKPENVFECKDGSIKVLDFGLARVREEANAKRLTTTGVPMGTPAFMAPEQALAHWDKVDARSDVFAIGATMFTLLTAQLVHRGSTVPEILVSACTKQVPPIQSILPELSPHLAYVIDRALAFAPENRWPDADAMFRGLREAISGQLAGRFALRESFDAASTTKLDPARPEHAAAGRQAPAVIAQTAAPLLAPRTTESPFSTGTGRGYRQRKAATGVLAVGLALFLVAGGVFFMVRGGSATLPGTASTDVGTGGAANSIVIEPHTTTEATPSVPTGDPLIPVTSTASPSVSGSSSVTAKASSTVKVRTVPTLKPCKVDPFTQRCAK